MTEAKEEAESEKEKTELQNQINTTQQEINNLKNGTTESEGSYALMWEAVTTVLEIKTLDATVKSAQEDMAEAEQTFVDAMGNMLHDGYWNNSNYTVGQEESLYADAVEILKIMSRPAVTYSMSFLNLAALSDYKMEEIKLNMRVRIYDFELGVNDWGFIERIVEYPLAERENTVTISTDELNIGSSTFESVLNRMMEAANIIDQRNAIYERAAAISEGGTISADQLNGEIDLLKNHLASTKSGWYTDANGNIMFEAQDGQSAMMLSGSGFMVANGKDASGNWNWRTFGTGEGFTADLITAGILRAGTITILGTDQFYWDADNIYIFDPSDPDRQIRIGKYDGANYGIGYTTDNGKTWQNAIGFDGVTLSASATETINSLGDRVTEVESKVTPDAIVQTVTESETYQNEIGGLDQRISTAESKLTPEAMETTIENSEALSEVRQTADKITWIIEGGTSSSNMTMTEDALSVISEGITLTADKINLVADDINLTGNTSVNTIVNNATDELQTQIQQNADNISLVAGEAELAKSYISDTPPDAPIEKGKLWIDTGAEPDIWRFWRGADVTTEREYEEIRTGSGKNLLKNTQEFTGVAGASTFTGETYNGFAVRSGSSANISSDFIEFAQWDDAVDAELGKTYTFSFWAKGSGKLYAFFYRGNDNQPIVVTSISSQGESDARADGQIFFTLSGDWERYWVKWTISGTGDMTNPKKAVLLRLYKTDSATASVCGAQLEEGSEATNYEPRENTPYFAIDNAQGQIESVAVEAGCRVRQAGNGQRRNLLKNTQAFTGVIGISELTGEKYNGFAIRAYDGPTSADFGEFAQWSGAIYPKLNGIYTFSFWAKGTGIIDSYFWGNGTVAVSHVVNSQGVESTSDDGNSKFTLSSTWTRYWVRWTLSGDGDITIPKNVLLRLFSGNNSASVCGAQLEEGSTLTDWTPAPGDYAPITGRESVEIAACGKNLVDLGDLYVSTSNAEMSLSGDSVRVYTTGDGGTWLGAHTPVFTIHAGVPYTLSATLDAYVSGNARIGLRGAENNTFLSGITLVFGSGTGSLSATFTPNADEEVYLSLLCTNDTTLSGDCTFSNIQLEIGNVATEYEPYRSIGGGTVTPTEPLYGLPGAEDTVEMSTDGDVTVTRRTGVKILTGTENWYTMSEWNPGSIAVLDILPDCKPVNDTSEVTTARCSHFPAYTANSVVHVISGDGFAINYGTGLYIRISGCETVDDCKAYLAAQYAAGTPVTIVYELAAPETEALTAISPIAPQPGQLNLFTDADALTATIYGSGWETVNDTTDLRDGLDDAQSDISSMLGSINTMRDNISAMASQILSPDEIVTTVTESDEWQSQTTQITQNGEGLALVQVTVTDLGGRMDTMEGVIVIDPPNIDIGSSDSNTKLHLDNEGWDILSGGSATISARENKVVAPRFQVTDALMIGGLAFRVSNGHLYLLKNGG